MPSFNGHTSENDAARRHPGSFFGTESSMRLTSNVSRFSVGSFQPEEDASEQPLPSWFSASSYTHQVAAAILQYGPIARTTLAQLLGLS
ncbi:MAG: hypothetical protein ABF613_09165, partial [Bifidobacterium aquikefiri]